MLLQLLKRARRSSPSCRMLIRVAEAQQTPSVKSNVGNPQPSEAERGPEATVSAPSVVQKSEVQAASTTKFRGLFIGMTRSDVENLGNDFLVKFEKADPTANPCNGSKEASCQIANSMS